jgi:uncharacterized small protein (DUF1192 family)
MALRHRLRRLEGARKGPPAPGGQTYEEILVIDKDIARLDAELEKVKADMSPEELAQSQAEFWEVCASVEGLSLDEEIAALATEIERLETLQRNNEGRSLDDGDKP